MPFFLVPLLWASTGAGLGAYFESKSEQDNAVLPQGAALMGVNPTTIAYYAALGLGVYWLAKKSGAIK